MMYPPAVVEVIQNFAMTGLRHQVREKLHAVQLLKLDEDEDLESAETVMKTVLNHVTGDIQDTIDEVDEMMCKSSCSDIHTNF